MVQLDGASGLSVCFIESSDVRVLIWSTSVFFFFLFLACKSRALMLTEGPPMLHGFLDQGKLTDKCRNRVEKLPMTGQEALFHGWKLFLDQNKTKIQKTSNRVFVSWEFRAWLWAFWKVLNSFGGFFQLGRWHQASLSLSQFFPDEGLNTCCVLFKWSSDWF